MTDARFRDPPPAAERARALELELAMVLLRVPALPAELPAFGVSLQTVEVEEEEVRLHLHAGKAPIARLKLTWPTGAPSLLAETRWDGPKTMLQERTILAMASRLSAHMKAATWATASDVVDKLRDLPRDLPLESFRQIVPGVRSAEGLVRTGFNCNQDCGLCWQGRRWGRFGADQIIAWIEDMHAAGARRLVISGGEPTLDASLPRYLERATELQFDTVTLETNAIQMAKPGFAKRLVDAGLQRTFVSLHSSDPQISDSITRAPGTHKKTIEGVRALLEAGVWVTFNAVISAEGLPVLADLPDYIRAQFGAHPKIDTLVISDMGDNHERALMPSLVPSPDAVRAVLPRLIERAVAVNLTLQGLGNPCGPHLCMFNADPRVTSLEPIPETVDFRRQLPACEGCTVRAACFGPRTRHASLFGDRCVRPIL